MPMTVSSVMTDAAIDAAFAGETLTPLLRALVRRVADLELRVRALEGDWQRSQELSPELFFWDAGRRVATQGRQALCPAQ
jgi:hypothetical protein